jgi:tRNA/tmRNA/rRNA uracil-C5-methylase (TrmA/RlmC/RlmD family)
VKTYKELLDQALRGCAPLPEAPQGFCKAASGRRCTLCNASCFTYDVELTAKRGVIQAFWQQYFPASLLSPLVPSPLGRKYRSISKRKLFVRGNTVLLGLIDPTQVHTDGILPVNACAIEPGSHQLVYRRVAEATTSRSLQSLFAVLRYVIVRGDERNTLVTLSVTDVAPSILKAANTLSKLLTADPSSVRAVYLHEDDGDGRYYLGGGDPAGRVHIRKLYGLQGLKHDVAGRRFFYPPSSFSQVNHSALELLVGTVRSLLHPESAATLLDLYCGYGLFGLTLADSFRQVVGADISPESISAAQDNAGHQKTRNARFLRSTLDEDSIVSLVRRCRPPLAVILDPPRSGTAVGMIPLIAGYGPTRVVHLFCNIERMPDELNIWEKEGYQLEDAVPIDMFPGTSSLEIVAGLKRTGEKH